MDRDAWKITETIARRYPKTLRRISDMEDMAMTRDPERAGSGSRGSGDSTSSPAIKLASSRTYQKLKGERDAVESALAGMDDLEREVIKQRYWTAKERGRFVKKSYEEILLPFSARTMRRINKRFIERLAVYIGEE